MADDFGKKRSLRGGRWPMGGVGSGGWQGSGKALVEDHVDLDVLELHRERRLEPGEWCYWI